MRHNTIRRGIALAGVVITLTLASLAAMLYADATGHRDRAPYAPVVTPSPHTYPRPVWIPSP